MKRWDAWRVEEIVSNSGPFKAVHDKVDISQAGPIWRLFMKPGPKKRPLATRLWAKVDRSAGPNACWPWLGGTNGRGYGLIALGGDSSIYGNEYVHRIAYALAHGIKLVDLPPKREVRHSCNNRLCCNSKHLLLGTSRDNKMDAIASGTMHWQRCLRDAYGRFRNVQRPSEDKSTL